MGKNTIPADAVITVEIPNYRKWQQDTHRKRTFVALDVGFYGDPKIQILQQRSKDATHVYLWLLMNLDYSTASLTIRASFLKKALQQVLNMYSNNFRLQKYLELLSRCELIRYSISNTDEIRSEMTSNRSQRSVKRDPTPSVEQAKTQAVTDSVHDKHDMDKTGEEDSGFLPTPPVFKNDSWFWIVRPGNEYPGGRYAETEWLRREIIRKIKSRHHHIRDAMSFEMLYRQERFARQVIERWQAYPIEKRLAAYVYAAIERQVVDELEWALKSLQEGWEGMKKNIAQAKQMLETSLEVVFDG